MSIAYKKLIFVHTIENNGSVPKISNYITERKNALVFVELIRRTKPFFDRFFIH
jgi:hypothetical protein